MACWLFGARETLNMLNYLKDYKVIFSFWFISWIDSDLSRKYILNNKLYCLPYKANSMPADALDTLGTRASACIVLIPKANYFVASIRRGDSWINVDLLSVGCSCEKWIQNAPCKIKSGFIRIIKLKMLHAKWEPLNLYSVFMGFF